MADVMSTLVRKQLQERRRKLQGDTGGLCDETEAQRLLHDVDAALSRMDEGEFGLCGGCKEPIETDRLIVDPLTRFCLDCLTPVEQRALEEDLELASRIQNSLLPRHKTQFGHWEIAFHYEGAGPTSGDYCDLVADGQNGLYVFVGDVVGKGLAASLLMTHLHATFRALVSFGMPLKELVERASRAFCESTLPTHFATLVCVKLDTRGALEIVVAGHHPPLLVRGGNTTPIQAKGLPLGLSCDERFNVLTMTSLPGDVLFLYTDGLSEAMNKKGSMYGTQRLQELLAEHQHLSPEDLLSACLEDLGAFCSGTPKADDLTIMVLKAKHT